MGLKDYLVDPDKKIFLSAWDPNETREFKGGKDDALEFLHKQNLELEELQEMLYAEHRHKILIVLQAMDTGGKDGVIRHVFEGVNPQGVKVAGFKVPTPEELDHDYLWRIHKHTPAKGEIVIFNRSHYEDVLVVRVHNIVPESIWSTRYEQINNFERMLAEEGTTILKFYLHIDKEEQKKRLLERLNDPTKLWKFNPGDLKDRALWSDYQKAHEELLNKTSKEWAPWYIIPANKKWYRNYLVASIIIETLKDLNLHYPEPKGDLSGIIIE